MLTTTLPGPAAAQEWLAAERPCLVSVARHGAAHGWPRHTVWLSGILATYLAGGHYDDALTIHGTAAEAGRVCGDRQGQARALLGLGGVHYRRLDRHEEATSHLQ